MSHVQIADGHNNTAGYQRFLYDPWTPQLVPGIQRISMTPNFSEDGWRSVELRWLPKVPQSVVTDVLSKCGLDSAISNEVTVSLPDNKERTTFNDYNGLALYDEDSEFERSGRPLVIRIINLEAI